MLVPRGRHTAAKLAQIAATLLLCALMGIALWWTAPVISQIRQDGLNALAGYDHAREMDRLAERKVKK